MVKTCAFCEKTDGMCYTSNPPKRKCTITGKFHEYDHICDVPITNADRFRAMSDEELAAYWVNCSRICDWCSQKEKCDTVTATQEQCVTGVLEWLKQPADEVAHER